MFGFWKGGTEYVKLAEALEDMWILLGALKREVKEHKSDDYSVFNKTLISYVDFIKENIIERMIKYKWDIDGKIYIGVHNKDPNNQRFLIKKFITLKEAYERMRTELVEVAEELGRLEEVAKIMLEAWGGFWEDKE